jgi:hypothetical protein
MNPSRRNLLTGILGATGFAAALAAGGYAWLETGYPEPGADGPVFLSAKEWSVLRALIEVLLPGDETFPPGLELGVHRRIDMEAWAAGADVRAELRALLQILEHSPLLLGRPTRFSGLVPQLRATLLDDIIDRGPDMTVSAVLILKRLVHFIAYANPEVWLFIGYEGPLVDVVHPDPAQIAYTNIREGRAP